MAESAIIARVLASALDVDATAWNALLARQSHPTPFMRHEYLAALQESGSAIPRTGWTPRFMTLWEGEALVAACPIYLKSHSYGEYVFDWAWASAYEQHGVPYYPKAVVAVPFTPVPGTRLMARARLHASGSCGRCANGARMRTSPHCTYSSPATRTWPAPHAKG